MKRKAQAAWHGGLKNGTGTISSEHGALNEVEYGFATRFGDEAGTNPEELIAAAHAACFSMALAHELERAKIGTGDIRTEATVTIEKEENSWAITHVHLDVNATIPGAHEHAFLEAAERAKRNCPVSQAINARISLTARLQEELAQAM